MLKFLYTSIIVLSVMTLCGCSHIFRHEQISSSSVKTFIDADVLQPEKLKAGAVLGIFPFVPGVDVAANERSDSVAAYIIKGATETAAEKFTVALGQDIQHADVIVRGEIVELDDRKCGRLSLGGCEKRIVVKGRVLSAGSSDDLIAIFQTRDISDDRSDDVGVMAQRLGRRIGRFLSSRAQ